MSAADFLPHEGARISRSKLIAAGARPWPQHRVVLWGGAGTWARRICSHIWAQRERRPPDRRGTEPARARSGRKGPVAIDDADQVPSEEALLHVVERGGRSRGRRLLLTFTQARRRGAAIGLAGPGQPPARDAWPIEIGPQDEAGCCAALLAKLLSERQLVGDRRPIQKWHADPAATHRRRRCATRSPASITPRSRRKQRRVPHARHPMPVRPPSSTSPCRRPPP